jgi:hypothetical protein
MFKCSICGKEYDTPVGRARCEIECDKANQAKAEQERNEKLKAEKNKRYDEIKCKANELETLIKQFNNDYGDSIWMRTPTPLTNWRTFWL